MILSGNSVLPIVPAARAVRGIGGGSRIERAHAVYLALTMLRLRHELNTSLRDRKKWRRSWGELGMLETAAADAGRLHHCPYCRSRRSLRNVYRCGDKHFFCEECAVQVLRGAMKLLTTTCPRCGKEVADTVGFIEAGSIHTRAPLLAPIRRKDASV
jgi:hypothetical protein